MDATQLTRIESLGDNCELGFVLRKLGQNAGSLFRWASMEIGPLTAMLRADFADLYRFDRLVPLRLSMVLDRQYGVGWHTEIVSEPSGATLAFRDGEAARRLIHRREKRKMDYLLAKFRARLASGGLVLVVKSNAGLDAGDVEALKAELSRFAAGAPFTLLEMGADPARAGTIEILAPGHVRGFVPAFAPYERADAGDMPAWTAVLSQTLALAPCADWPARVEAAQAAIPDPSIALPFPAGEAPSEPRVQLLGGNEWCRAVEGGFRVHGAAPSGSGTLLRWAPFALPGLHHLSGTVRSAVPDAAPVAVTVRFRNTARTDLRERRSVVTPDRPWVLDLAVDPDDPADVVLEIAVEATRPLTTGERAVVDLSPLTLHPAAP